MKPKGNSFCIILKNTTLKLLIYMYMCSVYIISYVLGNSIDFGNVSSSKNLGT